MLAAGNPRDASDSAAERGLDHSPIRHYPPPDPRRRVPALTGGRWSPPTERQPAWPPPPLPYPRPRGRSGRETPRSTDPGLKAPGADRPLTPVLLVPLLTPVLFALVVAPALANAVASPAQRTTYMTYIALATAGLLIPLNCMFSGLGVVVDRQHGALRELLVAPIRRSSIVAGNLVAAIATTACRSPCSSRPRRCGARTTRPDPTSCGSPERSCSSVVTYGLAEIMAARLPSAEAYTGGSRHRHRAVLLRRLAVPDHVAAELAGRMAKVLPLTHALALFRYGLTPANGGRGAAQHLGLPMTLRWRPCPCSSSAFTR